MNCAINAATIYLIYRTSHFEGPTIDTLPPFSPKVSAFATKNIDLGHGLSALLIFAIQLLLKVLNGASAQVHSFGCRFPDRFLWTNVVTFWCCCYFHIDVGNDEESIIDNLVRTIKPFLCVCTLVPKKAFGIVNILYKVFFWKVCAFYIKYKGALGALKYNKCHLVKLENFNRYIIFLYTVFLFYKVFLFSSIKCYVVLHDYVYYFKR